MRSNAATATATGINVTKRTTFQPGWLRKVRKIPAASATAKPDEITVACPQGK